MLLTTNVRNVGCATRTQINYTAARNLPIEVRDPRGPGLFLKATDVGNFIFWETFGGLKTGWESPEVLKKLNFLEAVRFILIECERVGSHEHPIHYILLIFDTSCIFKNCDFDMNSNLLHVDAQE